MGDLMRVRNISILRGGAKISENWMKKCIDNCVGRV